MSSMLSTDEVSALMSAIQEGVIEATPAKSQPLRGPVVAYDLTSRDRIIRGQMPTLDAINEQIASLFSTGLAGRTRLSIRVTSQPATLLKFMDLNSLLIPPATVGVMTLGQGLGMAIVVLEPGVGELLLAAAMGDRKARPDDSSIKERRDLTSVERNVLRRLLTIFTEGMAMAWSPVLPFKPEVIRFESDPRMAIIAPPNDTAILSSFEITGAINGRVQLVIPFTTVEPAKKLLVSPPRVNSGSDQRFTNALAQELQEVEVELSALLGGTSVPLSRILELEVGDVLILDSDEGQPVPVQVQGRTKLTGSPQISGGNLALVVEQTLLPPGSSIRNNRTFIPNTHIPVQDAHGNAR